MATTADRNLRDNRGPVLISWFREPSLRSASFSRREAVFEKGRLTFPFPPPPPWHPIDIGLALFYVAVFLLSVVEVFVYWPRRLPPSLTMTILFSVETLLIAIGFPVFHNDAGNRYIRSHDLELVRAAAYLPSVVLFLVLFLKFGRHRRDKIFSATVVLLLISYSFSMSLVHQFEAFARTECRNNLKKIGIAIYSYQAGSGGLLPTDLQGPRRPAQSWRVRLLPLLDQAQLYRTYQLDEPWDSPANRNIARIRLPVYQCRSAQRANEHRPRRTDAGAYWTDYAAVTGPGTAFGVEGAIDLDRIPDGSSNTMLVVEAAGTEIVWTEPRDLSVDEVVWRINAPGPRPYASPGVASSYHPTGTSVLMADGSVRQLDARASPELLRALTTVAGGETVEPLD